MAVDKRITLPLVRIMLGLVCLNAAFTAQSQSQIKFRQLSVQEGLSQNSAISITQDSIGYMWIATQDGLNKYDGRTFTTYPFTFVDITKPNYSNLGKVYTDRNGNVWIIPMDRIPYQLNRNTDIFDPLLGVHDASSIFMDRDFNLWIGTYANGLYALKSGQDKVRNVIPASLLRNTIYNLTQNDKGNLLLAMENEIAEYDPNNNRFKRLSTHTQLGEKIEANYSDIVVDDMGREWVGTFGNGLYVRSSAGEVLNRIDELSFTEALPANLNITDLHLDFKNRLWIATYGQGLYMIDFEAMSIMNFEVEKHNPTALHYNDVLSIYEDYTGTLWFGTDGAGVSYYDEYLEKFNSFTDFQTPENVSIDVVRAILVDWEKSVWIGTSGKGLTRYNPSSGSWRTYKTLQGDNNSISSDRVMSLYMDRENNLWIGTQEGGLNIMEPDGDILRFSSTSEIKLTANSIWCIYEDKEFKVWLGTRDHGLIQFDKEEGVMAQYDYDVKEENGIPSNNIRAIAADDEGNLWIGTDSHGIAFFDLEKKSFKSYQYLTNGKALSANGIKTLYLGTDNILWIGTNGGGLNAFDVKNHQFYHYSEKDGLANDVIYGILPDDENNLWLSSNKGITKFTIGDSLDATPEIMNYNNYEGLATEFNTGAAHKDAEGNLYFGGLDGFYWFRPKNINVNSILPKTAITGLEVFNSTVPLVEGLALEANQNTISFTFSSLQYSLPQKNQYQYRLVNFDTEWIYSGNKNFARYTRLPPGDYKFQVKSSNYDGLWNSVPVSYSFSILAPWYLTTHAKMVYVLLLFMILYGVYAYLKWRWRMQVNLRLKAEETQRFKELNDLKSKLYTDISHEFRTPLTLISGPVDVKLGQADLSETDLASFSLMKRNINRLIALVDQLLNLAKLEKGKLKLKIAKGDLGLFLGMLASSFKYRAMMAKIDYRVEIDPLPKAWFDEDAMEKIVVNLLSNAFKYVKQEGECQFTAVKKDGKVQISVKNSVDNYSDIDVELIFTRFYQKDAYSDGAGIGLSLVKELVHMYQGTITVQLEEDDIIHFMVSLPLLMSDFRNLEVIEKIEEECSAPINNGPMGLVQKKKPLGRTLEAKNLPIVLIVEDHEEVREFLNAVWSTKYRILQAGNGLKGVKMALEVVPDLIISDVRMPLSDGIELCNKLKTDERTSHVPIILLTAGLEEEQELQGLLSGADDFIAKPFKLRILETRVENLIGTRKMLRKRYSHEFVLKAKDIALTPTDEVFLNRLEKVLEDNLLNSQFNASAFCQKLGMSRMQLHRKLLTYTGLSTTAFIRSQRLKRAIQIMKTTDASVNEVAYSVGFNTPSYFIKCFKEVYGKTPTEYVESGKP